MRKTHLNIILNLLAIGIVLFHPSCSKDEGPFIIAPVGTTTPSDSTHLTDTVNNKDSTNSPTVYTYTILYSVHVKPLLAFKCVQGCHNPSHPKLDLRPPVSYVELLTDGASAPYVDTIQPGNSIIHKHLTGEYTPMPKDGPSLSQGKIDTIYTWISQGAKNN